MREISTERTLVVKRVVREHGVCRVSRHMDVRAVDATDVTEVGEIRRALGGVGVVRNYVLLTQTLNSRRKDI
jgi:hypothetical protein